MTLEKATKILFEIKEIYNDQHPGSYEKFIEFGKSFDRTTEEGNIAGMMYDFILDNNRAQSTKIWRIDKYREEQILNYLSNNLPQQA